MDIGLAGVKLSGSINKNGLVSEITIRILISRDAVIKSLEVNRG